MTANRVELIESRFWQKVDKDGPVPEHDPSLGPCWLWTGSQRGSGYGECWNGTRTVAAHRFSYAMSNGPFDKRLDICHRCDTPLCVRGSHLFAGTRTDNMRDMSAKGRHQYATRTHCSQGHPWDEKNTYLSPSNGSRQCRQCNAEKSKARRTARAAVR